MTKEEAAELILLGPGKNCFACSTPGFLFTDEYDTLMTKFAKHVDKLLAHAKKLIDEHS